MVLFKLACREVFSRKRLTLLILLNLTVASAGLILVTSFESSISRQLGQKSLELLGADLNIYGRRRLSTAEIERLKKALPEQAHMQLSHELHSMVVSKKSSRLTQIKVITNTFPFYGDGLVRRQDGKLPFRKAVAELDSNEVLVYPELLPQLDLKLGDPLRIGVASFTVRGVVEKDVPSAGLQDLLAPRIYLLSKALAATKLIRRGSLVNYHHMIRLPANVAPESIRPIIRKTLDDSTLRIRTPIEATERISRLASHVNDFLGLVMVCALFLALIAATFLFRILMAQKTRDLGTLMALGCHAGQISWLILIELSILVVLATGLSTFFAVLFMPLFQQTAAFMIPMDVQINVDLIGVLLTFLVVWTISFLACLPSFAAFRRTRPATLFREHASESVPTNLWLWATPVAIFLLSMSIWQANSWKVGGGFFVGLTISVVLFIALGWTLLLLSKLVSPKHFSWWFALAHLRRNPSSSLVAFVALCIATATTTLVPQVSGSLQRDLSMTAIERLPGLFLFDIQEEDIPTLRDTLSKSAKNLNELSPLVQARLLKLNGAPFGGKPKLRTQTREQDRANFFRNRLFNLSSRPTLLASETITQGEVFSGPYNANIGEGPPVEISVEEGFANDVGIHIGDELEFEIEGVMVLTKVRNLRKVRWASFQPNFFVMLQNGALDEAPKTYLATVRTSAGHESVAIQRQIIKAAPNVSIVDVRRTVESILQMTRNITKIIQFMAWLVMLAGLAVFISILFYQIQRRRWDISLLKSLGAKHRFVRTTFALEFVSLASTAGICGSLLGQINSLAISRLVFETAWQPSLNYVLISLIVTVVLGLALTLIAVQPILRQTAITNLQNDSN